MEDSVVSRQKKKCNPLKRQSGDGAAEYSSFLCVDEVLHSVTGPTPDVCDLTIAEPTAGVDFVSSNTPSVCIKTCNGEAECAGQPHQMAHVRARCYDRLVSAAASLFRKGLKAVANESNEYAGRLRRQA
eukprot:4662201-Pyramimonas_sp.AAC.1